MSIENINERVIQLEDEHRAVRDLERLYRRALKARRTRADLEGLGDCLIVNVTIPSVGGTPLSYTFNGKDEPGFKDRLVNLLVEVGEYCAAKTEKQISEELDKVGQLRNPTGESK